MSHADHYRRLEVLYASAPINAFYAPKMEISSGTTELRIPLKAEFHHGAGAVHGSVYFKALDDAAFFAVNSLSEDFLVLTVSFTVNLMRPVVEGELLARGRVTGHSGNLFFAEATLMDHHEHMVAQGTGVFARSQISIASVE